MMQDVDANGQPLPYNPYGQHAFNLAQKQNVQQQQQQQQNAGLTLNLGANYWNMNNMQAQAGAAASNQAANNNIMSQYSDFCVREKLLQDKKYMGGLIVQTPYGQGVLLEMRPPMAKVQLSHGGTISIQSAKVLFHASHALPPLSAKQPSFSPSSGANPIFTANNTENSLKAKMRMRRDEMTSGETSGEESTRDADGDDMMSMMSDTNGNGTGLWFSHEESAYGHGASNKRTRRQQSDESVETTSLAGSAPSSFGTPFNGGVGWGGVIGGNSVGFPMSNNFTVALP